MRELIFGLVFFIALAVGWYLHFRNRRELLRLDEEKQMLAQEKQIVLEFMHNMVEAIGDGVSRTALFQRVVHAAVLSTGALSACVFERTLDNRLRGVAVEGLFPPHRPLPDSSKGKLTTRAKFIEQVLRSETFKIGEGIVGACAASNEGLLITDAENDPRIVKHDDPALKVRSVIVAPIKFRDTSIGVLAVVNPADGGIFNETDFSLVQSLAEQAGLAIHNLDLMALQIEKNKLDVDLALASSIQGMLLQAEFPEFSDVQVEAFYRPAQKVGGDLYDVVALPEGRVGVAVADVSGKGVPASLLMAICQTNLRHFARQHKSPAAVLRAMNEAMVNEMREDMFITMVYGVYDPAKGQLTVARAGHERPIVLHGEHGRVEMLGPDGMALGMVPDELFAEVIEDCVEPFAPGDLLCLYTDGVTEIVNSEGTELGTARMTEALQTLRERPLKELVDGLVETALRFSADGEQGDDLTLLLMRAQ